MLRMPWNEERYQLADHGGGKKLVFGMMHDDGYVRSPPPYERALKEVAAALKAAGHEVVEWKAYKADQGYQLFVSTRPPYGSTLDLADMIGRGMDGRWSRESDLLHCRTWSADVLRKTSSTLLPSPASRALVHSARVSRRPRFPKSASRTTGRSSTANRRS